MSPRLKQLVELFSGNRNDFKLLRRAAPGLESVIDRLERLDKEVATLVTAEVKL